MNSLRCSLNCASSRFRRWITDWRVYLFAVVVVTFAIYDYQDLVTFAARYDARISAWSVAAYLSPSYMIILYSLLAALLFSDAPFYDESSQFAVIRTGRLNWILGQFIYIALASLLITVLIWLAAWVVLLPRISFANDWGAVIKTLANNSPIPSDISVRIPVPNVINEFDPMQTAALSFLMMWLAGVFIGTFFMFFNSVCGKLISFSIYGFLLFLSQSASFIGMFIFGDKAYYLMPLTFCNLFNTAHFSGNPNLPPLWYCICVLGGLAIVFTVVTTISFCKRDLVIGKDG